MITSSFFPTLLNVPVKVIILFVFHMRSIFFFICFLNLYKKPQQIFVMSIFLVVSISSSLSIDDLTISHLLTFPPTPQPSIYASASLTSLLTTPSQSTSTTVSVILLTSPLISEKPLKLLTTLFYMLFQQVFAVSDVNSLQL